MLREHLANPKLDDLTLRLYQKTVEQELQAKRVDIEKDEACIYATYSSPEGLRQLRLAYPSSHDRKVLTAEDAMKLRTADLGRALAQSNLGVAAAERARQKLRAQGVRVLKFAVVVFPASNCDRDAAVALEQLTGEKPHMAWHAGHRTSRCRSDRAAGWVRLRRLSPDAGRWRRNRRIMRDVKIKADQGVTVLGICNGFQVLTGDRTCSPVP